MKAIQTKILPPTSFRPRRVKASDLDGNSIILSVDESTEKLHEMAALALLRKMDWKGRLVGGHFGYDMVWVFSDGAPEVKWGVNS